jgi:hypothetical protein
LTRLTIALAVATGIAPDVWADQDWRTIVTAAELLSKKKSDKDDDRQMSG